MAGERFGVACGRRRGLCRAGIPLPNRAGLPFCGVAEGAASSAPWCRNLLPGTFEYNDQSLLLQPPPGQQTAEQIEAIVQQASCDAPPISFGARASAEPAPQAAASPPAACARWHTGLLPHALQVLRSTVAQEQDTHSDPDSDIE